VIQNQSSTFQRAGGSTLRDGSLQGIIRDALLEGEFIQKNKARITILALFFE